MLPRRWEGRRLSGEGPQAVRGRAAGCPGKGRRLSGEGHRLSGEGRRPGDAQHRRGGRSPPKPSAGRFGLRPDACALQAVFAPGGFLPGRGGGWRSGRAAGPAAQSAGGTGGARAPAGTAGGLRPGARPRA